MQICKEIRRNSQINYYETKLNGKLVESKGYNSYLRKLKFVFILVLKAKIDFEVYLK